VIEWSDVLRSKRDKFVDRLVSVGYRPSINDSYILNSNIDIPELGKTIEVEVSIPEGFPFVPPKVRPTPADGNRSWHLERDNSLCLWSAESEPSHPWLDPEVVLERIRKWFIEDAGGWVNDLPDLDLERYWEPHGDEVLFLHNGLSDSHGFLFDVEPKWVSKNSRIYRVKRRWLPNMHMRRRHEKVLVIDVGDLKAPPREYDHLLDCVKALYGTENAAGIDRLVQNDVNWLLVRYERKGNPGILALRVTNRKPVCLKCVHAAEDSERVRDLRRGIQALSLGDVRVAIVGVGAIGSFVADQLVRSGVAHLTLFDNDIVRPGNLPRHLVSSKYIGRCKVDAIADQLCQNGLLDRTKIEVRRSRLEPLEVERLLKEHDLVIDATANAIITKALADASQLTSRPLVTVCVQHDGTVVRVDRYPISIGEKHDQPVPRRDEVPFHSPGYEGGCGDPVSPTPPYSCIAAASLAASVAMSVVSGSSLPPTIIQHLYA